MTAEDGFVHGGAGQYLRSVVEEAAAAAGALPPFTINLGVPATYVAHGAPESILARLGLDGEGIAASAIAAVRRLEAAPSLDPLVEMTVDHARPTLGRSAFEALDVGSIADKASSENFPVALRILPGDLREHRTAIYAYARLIDDLGDRYEGDRLAALDRAEGELDRAFRHEPTHAIFTDIAATVEAGGTGREPLIALIDANRLDQHKTRYATFSELEEYCALSANPVGRLVLGAFGAADEPMKALSDRICTGLQVVEHLQDVGEDARDGRVYLPEDDLDRFGVVRSDLCGTESTPALRRLVAFEAARARATIVEGLPLLSRFTGTRRIALAGFAGGGLAQLDEIERRGFDVLGGLAKASKGSVLVQTAVLAFGAARGGR